MKQFVRVLCDVECKWTGKPPVYRAYIDDELFAERTWIWHNEYLEEMFQIEAVPGDYAIRYELVSSPDAFLKVSNIRVEHGPGRIIDNTLRIGR